METQMDVPQDATFPQKPFIAGFWLIAQIPAAILVLLPLETWVHREDLSEMFGLPLLALVFGATAFMWGHTLMQRSGLEPNKWVGIAAAIAFPLTIMGVYAGFDRIFASFIELLNITGDTNQEFIVIFVLWTGIVTGGTGFGIGLALKQPKLALKLLRLGFVAGALVFFLIAVTMQALGFQVGTPRPDGIPSMPVVTLLGIWSAALVGSELFGRTLAKSR